MVKRQKTPRSSTAQSKVLLPPGLEVRILSGGLMPYADPNARREYARKWVANRRAEFFKDKTCVDCGSSENLELDHIDPLVKVSHRIWSWSAEKRAAEIAKCVVRCRSCHAAKTWNGQGRKRADHGTFHKYTHGCRCGPCTEANRIHRLKWRCARSSMVERDPLKIGVAGSSPVERT